MNKFKNIVINLFLVFILSFYIIGCSDSDIPNSSDSNIGFNDTDKEDINNNQNYGNINDTNSSSPDIYRDPTANVDIVKTVTVSFDPYDGHFYYATGKTHNPDRVEILPGIVNEPVAPWKEGCKFKGWYKDYSTWKDKWDFKTIVTENMTLYALFEPSNTPDTKPAISYISYDLYDMGLKPTPITEFDEGKNTKTLWVKGVNEKEGWQDHRQYTNNCWGTTSSQMLDWFFKQDKFKEFLVKNSNAPKSIDDMRKWFLDLHGEWGWIIRLALSAYFDRFFPDLNLSQYMYNYNGNNKAFTLETFSALLYRHLSKGDMGGISGFMFANQPHAMSLWGAEFDKDGLVVALWLTTSECTNDEGILKPRLNKYERSSTSKEGHYKWSASYEYYSSTGGYYSTYHTFVSDIYTLCFLNGSDTDYSK